jgi:hypothetical protein
MRIQNHSLPFGGLFLAALFAPFSGLAQSTAPIPRIELKSGEKIVVPNRFATGGVDPIRCDRAGNIYMRPVSGMETSLSGPILKILSDGSNSVLFDANVVPELKEAKEVTIEDFNVSRSGQVYELLSINDKEGKRSIAVLEFADEGRSASLTRVDARFLPRQLALFLSGQFLLSGAWKSDPPQGKTGKAAESEREQKPFIGIFDRKGKLVQEVLLPRDVHFDTGPKQDEQRPENLPGTAIDLSRTLTGDDGSIYFLRAGPNPTIYVISPAGEILRYFSIKPPTEHAANPSAFLGAGRLVFDFYEPRPQETPRTRLIFLVVDAQTGEELWLYEPAKDLFGIPACYSGQDFTFLSMTPDRHLALLRASAR